MTRTSRRLAVMSDSDSDFGSSVPARAPDEIEIKTPVEVIEDLTAEDDLLGDGDSESSLPSLELRDGMPSVKPRGYQTEMLEESLKHNIIIAADTGSGKTHMQVLLSAFCLWCLLWFWRRFEWNVFAATSCVWFRISQDLKNSNAPLYLLLFCLDRGA